jgi:hypothetical protein
MQSVAQIAHLKPPDVSVNILSAPCQIMPLLKTDKIGCVYVAS